MARHTAYSCPNEINGLRDGVPHVDTSLETENAAPDGPRSGAKTTYETTEFQDERYDLEAIAATEFSSRQFFAADRIERTFRLASGASMRLHCAPDGLVGGRDFDLADGSVVRIERRVTVVSPSSTLDTSILPITPPCDRLEAKRLFLRMWEDMADTDRTSFIARHVVTQMQEGAS